MYTTIPGSLFSRSQAKSFNTFSAKTFLLFFKSFFSVSTISYLKYLRYYVILLSEQSFLDTIEIIVTTE